MAEAKTTPTKASVQAFLAKVKDPAMRADCDAVVELMSGIAKAPPVMWGPSIVGFGSYTYTYASGRSGDWPLLAFSPRAKQLVLYVMPGWPGFDEMVAAVGPAKCGVSCLYVKRLSDLDRPALKRLLKRSVAETKKRHGSAVR